MKNQNMLGWVMSLCLSASIAAMPQAGENEDERATGRAGVRGGSPPIPAPAVSMVERSTGLATVDGKLWAVGPDYKVRFTKDGFLFVPALGERASKSMPLRFTLESVRRTRGATLPALPVEPVRCADGRAVRYERPDFVETYDIRADGIEQSFTFAALPAGSGDLVVRGRIDTELRPSFQNSSEDGLSFATPGLGGVHIGTVTGISADGGNVRGSMRFADGALELILPAAFVDTAVLPLVLDPLFGTSLTIAEGAQAPAKNPDLAFDATSNVFLTVWEHHSSANDVDIHGQLVNIDGTLNGGVLIIQGGNQRSLHPRVANVNIRDAFVVAWDEGGAIFATGVTAAGAVLAQVIVGLGDQPDVGGEAVACCDDTMVVWRNVGLNKIYVQEVEIQPGPIVALLGGNQEISSNPIGVVANPAIAKSGGPARRHLVVWSEGSPVSEIHGAVIDSGANVLDRIRITDVAGNDEDDPEVDGDGTDWVCAYETESVPGGGNNDIACRRVTYDSSTGLLMRGPEVSVAASAIEEEQASVAFLGASYLIGYSDGNARVKSVDAFTCLLCEGSFFLQAGADQMDHVMIAATYSADTSVQWGAMLVWQVDTLATSKVRGHRFRADDGVVTDLLGGCGAGGSARATCAGVPNLGFRHRLRGAAPAAPAFLVIGFAQLNQPCGGGACVLVPNPAGVLGPVMTNTLANTQLPMAIPNDPALVGAKFIDQWAVISGAPVCAGFGVDLSNAVEVEIQ